MTLSCPLFQLESARTMSMRLLPAIVAALSLPLLGHAATPSASCESLAKLTLPNAVITSAQSIGEGEFKLPKPAPPPAGMLPPAMPAGVTMMGPPPVDTSKMPAFCRVALTLQPSSDSEIKTEVWLPASGWNGKFVGVANFGTGGAIQYRNMIDPLEQGYALAANDTGHEGGSAGFAIGHPEKMIDYGYRANHEMTLKAKEIVTKFYGKSASRSIWVGCSLGGIQALIEAKRYPEDYDAIVAGAPPNPLTLFNAQQLWGAWLTAKFPEGAIPGSKFGMIHEAAVKACGTPVGLAQGFIEDPERCNFDPGTLLCKAGDAPDCLTALQVERLRQLYAGPVDPRTNQVIFPGPAYGAENELAMTSVKPLGPPLDLYSSMVYQNPNWDFTTLDFAASVDKATKELDPLLRVDANELKTYLDHGGKLMFYVGWTEGHNANDLVKFYKEILKNIHPDKADNVRLFLVPGMNHCGGGMGCDTFERVGTVDQWAATGKAPDQLLSSKVSAGKTIRTRPLCAYPAVAKYKGTGSMEEASSFICTK